MKNFFKKVLVASLCLVSLFGVFMFAGCDKDETPGNGGGKPAENVEEVVNFVNESTENAKTQVNKIIANTLDKDVTATATNGSTGVFSKTYGYIFSHSILGEGEWGKELYVYDKTGRFCYDGWYFTFKDPENEEAFIVSQGIKIVDTNLAVDYDYMNYAKKLIYKDFESATAEKTDKGYKLVLNIPYEDEYSLDTMEYFVENGLLVKMTAKYIDQTRADLTYNFSYDAVAKLTLKNETHMKRISELEIHTYMFGSSSKIDTTMFDMNNIERITVCGEPAKFKLTQLPEAYQDLFELSSSQSDTDEYVYVLK